MTAKIPYPDEKHYYLLRRMARKASSGCPIAREKWGKYRYPDTLHHAKVHNTIVNRKKYTLFVHSLLNLEAVSLEGNTCWSSWGKVSEREAIKYELFLRRHPRMAYYLNTLRKGTTLDAVAWAL